MLFDTAISTSNQGDEIIYEDCKKGLNPILHNAMIFRMGTHIVNYSSYQLIRKEDVKIKRICDGADYKFICGTNLVADDLRGVNPQWMVNQVNARLYKDSVFVGVGRKSDYKKPNSYTKKLYDKVLSKEYAHSVRDEDTKIILEDMGFKAINTGCPTLWGFNKDKCAAIPTKKADEVIFTVSGFYYQRNPEADKKMIETLRKNYSKLYFWAQAVRDEEYCREITDMSDITCIYSLEKYKEVLNSGNVDYVGTRLHGGVFAMQNDCRALVIAIDQRARGFHRDNNISILERDNIDELDRIINSDIITDIHVDEAAIAEFLNQFEHTI